MHLVEPEQCQECLERCVPVINCFSRVYACMLVCIIYLYASMFCVDVQSPSSLSRITPN